MSEKMWRSGTEYGLDPETWMYGTKKDTQNFMTVKPPFITYRDKEYQIYKWNTVDFRGITGGYVAYGITDFEKAKAFALMLHGE